MNTLTVPKIKDLVNKPNEQYKDIFNTLHKEKKQLDKSNALEDSSSAMTNELTQFFNDLKKTSTLANPTLANPTLANSTLANPLNDNNKSEPLGEPLTSSSNSSTYSPY